MANPFKFGSVVDNDFFTDRTRESEEVATILGSSNHLIIISPRRFGKTSLVQKVTNTLNRPVIYIDLQLITDVPDFATQLLKKILKINRWEHIKQFLNNFRIVPTIALNPQSDTMEVSFTPTVNSNFTALEDVLNVLETMGEKGKKPIVIFDEFQEITSLSKTLPKQLRAVIQHHSHVNYVFLGSMESMMRSIFESKKSPFYHFGYLMTLQKIPRKDFFNYLHSRFSPITNKNHEIAEQILDFTDNHPYYTQQLAFYCWNFLEKHTYSPSLLHDVISTIVRIHDTDYERLWNTLTQTDKKILITIALQEKISSLPLPTSTTYSGLHRLLAQGYIIKHTYYELDDSFFKQWIIEKRNS
ncbi:MAG: ATP-binding protein [Bacteroidales bacterium]|jgi:AAA+ ATPase superfamily predicted ATPase|nr:ATP-binding protein [Bacteroidales bacterium]